MNSEDFLIVRIQSGNVVRFSAYSRNCASSLAGFLLLVPLVLRKTALCLARKNTGSILVASGAEGIAVFSQSENIVGRGDDNEGIIQQIEMYGTGFQQRGIQQTLVVTASLGKSGLAASELPYCR